MNFLKLPKVGDSSKVLFYKGSGDVDVVFTNVIETVKVGDTLDIDNLPPDQGTIFNQDVRTVTGINTLDSVETNVYPGPGVTSDRSVLRPVTWCKQKVDKIVNGKVVGKDRIGYEPQIYPTSYLIQPVGLGSTEVYVDSLRPLFDSNNESQVRDFQNLSQLHHRIILLELLVRLLYRSLEPFPVFHLLMLVLDILCTYNYNWIYTWCFDY